MSVGGGENNSKWNFFHQQQIKEYVFIFKVHWDGIILNQSAKFVSNIVNLHDLLKGKTAQIFDKTNLIPVCTGKFLYQFKKPKYISIKSMKTHVQNPHLFLIFLYFSLIYYTNWS